MSVFGLFLAGAAAAFVPSPFLPPLLQFENGTAVTSASQWPARRAEISSLLQTVVVGTLPTALPVLSGHKVLNTTAQSGGCSSWLELTFTLPASVTPPSISFDIEVFLPTDSVGQSGQLPVFLTQPNHREWALVGFNRGYLSVVYPGGDTRDVAPAFQAAYAPSGATMALIVARAFVVSRVLDFVLSPGAFDGVCPSFSVSSSASSSTSSSGPAAGTHASSGIVNVEQVCITGHSRNGKQALLAAAFDPRIAAVVGSSPGAPISSPFRFSSSNFYGEGPPYSHKARWWLPSVVNYTDHPETMPIDGHAVLAMIAPRAAAVAHGWTDHEGEEPLVCEVEVDSLWL